MGRIRYLFLDDGGVINDNSLRAPQWRRLVGEFFAPRLGGTKEAWAEVNRAVFPGVWQRSVARLDAWDSSTGDVLHETYRYNVDWLRSMCEAMGIEAPVSDDDCAGLAREASGWILPQVRASFPGVEGAVREMAQDFTLFTASGSLSYELAANLGGLGIDGLFQRLYGPDLVNTPKLDPTFHERIFADAGVDPASAVVVDDLPQALHGAQEAGALTVLVSLDHRPGSDVDAVIGRLADLPALLRDLQRLDRIG